MKSLRLSRILSLVVCGTIAAAPAMARAADTKGEKEVGGLGLSGAPSEAAPEGELQLPATPEKGIVRLTLKTSNPQIQLKRNVATIMTSQTTGLLIQDLICRAPCGVIVDGRKGEQFFFGGMDVIASDTFQLIDYSGNVEATVKEGSHGAFWGAVWGITLGLSAAIGGLTWAAVGDAKWGLITAAVGVGMTVGGWVLYTRAGKTTVEFRPLSPS
jgi:hypothetical protein